MKSFKKLILMFIMLVSVISLSSINVFANDDFEIGVNNLNGTEENSAKVGDILLHPEKGWRRYDDSNGKIKYIKSWTGVSGRGYGTYNGTYHTNNTNISSEIKFKFHGSKLRIITWNLYDNTGADIIIDGVDYGKYSNYSPREKGPRGSYLFFEKLGLENKVHDVVIKCIDKCITPDATATYFTFDALDIDGTLLSYDANNNIILDIEAEKQSICLNENVTANVVIDNVKEIAAEDMIIKYDYEKLKFLGAEEALGIKVVKDDESQGQLRIILASQGKSNIANAKKILLKLNFQGIAAGDALVDITKGKISDGIEMERDLLEYECGQATITIEDFKDPSKDGKFTLLDLAIDGRHYGENPADLPQYKTDVVENGAIDDDDLLKIGEYMLENPNYSFN